MAEQKWLAGWYVERATRSGQCGWGRCPIHPGDDVATNGRQMVCRACTENPGGTA